MSTKNGAGRAGAEMRTKTFYAPPDCRRFCREFVMRELNGDDDLDVAVWIDAVIERKPALAESGSALLKLQRTEGMRRALVSVDGNPVNVGGAPWRGMDLWSWRMMQFVGKAFQELNGMEMAEGKAFVSGEYEGTPDAPMSDSLQDHSIDAPSSS